MMISNGMFELWNRNEFNKIKILKSNKYEKKSEQIDSSSSKVINTMKPLTSIQLQSLYYFFLIGVCISIVSLLIEIYLFFVNQFNFC